MSIPAYGSIGAPRPITQTERLDTAARLAAHAAGTGTSHEGDAWTPTQAAEALMMLGLHETPLVERALTRHGHQIPEARSSTRRTVAGQTDWQRRKCRRQTTAQTTGNGTAA